MPEKIPSPENNGPKELSLEDFNLLSPEEKKKYHLGLGSDGKRHAYPVTPELIEEEDDIWSADA